MSEITAVLRRSWVSHFWTNLATTAILTLSFTLILATILFTTNLSRIFSVWGDEIQITVYLKDDISPDALRAAEAAMKAQDGVESVQYTDKKAAESSFEKSLSSYGPNFLKAIKTDGDNPFPASFQVRVMAAQKTPEKIESLAQDFTKLTGVEDVSYGQEWLQNYTTLIKISRYIAFVVAFVLLSACVFAVSNAIQASLFSRRDEIEILELVGATSKTIRRPFLIEGAFQGLLAIVCSTLILTVSYQVVYASLERVMGSSSILNAVSFLPVATVFLFLFIGTCIGALGSYVCVARLNTGWAAASESRA
jgi:cell division transport system permease protein